MVSLSLNNTETLNNSSCENKEVVISSLNPGSKFKIADEPFVVVEHTDNGTLAVLENIIENKVFGKTSDWLMSPIRSFLNNEYFNKIKKAINVENLIPMGRRLTSLDGLEDYGFCMDNVSLLSAQEYIQYHKTLGVPSTYPQWWWTITPTSTPSNGINKSCCCIDRKGSISFGKCYYKCGIRPLICINTHIYVDVGV